MSIISYRIEQRLRSYTETSARWTKGTAIWTRANWSLNNDNEAIKTPTSSNRTRKSEVSGPWRLDLQWPECPCSGPREIRDGASS